VIVVGQENKEWTMQLVQALSKEFPQIKSLHSCVNLKVNDSIHDLPVQLEFGESTIIETLGHVKFHIGPKSFFQTNSKQAEVLYSLTKKMAGLQKTENAYDLYCGVGSLGIYMADHCNQVIGIEQIAEAIEDAKENAKLNAVENIHFAVGRVELMMDPAFIAQHGKPDVVITDPPRAGMHPDVITHLLHAEPNRIVYVSCNPATQARDIKMLSEQYELISAIPVDMFPHTHHIESIALLQRK
jgi:23S rRNA (uracil1939-C5)-methyltransferase